MCNTSHSVTPLSSQLTLQVLFLGKVLQELFLNFLLTVSYGLLDVFNMPVYPFKTFMYYYHHDMKAPSKVKLKIWLDASLLGLRLNG